MEFSLPILLWNWAVEFSLPHIRQKLKDDKIVRRVVIFIQGRWSMLMAPLPANVRCPAIFTWEIRWTHALFVLSEIIFSGSSDLDAWPKQNYEPNIEAVVFADDGLGGEEIDTFSVSEMLTDLYLQENSLSGPLPSLSDLSNLQTAYFGHNNFTSVPSTAFSGLTSLQKLSLFNNPSLSSWPFPTDLTQSSTLSDLNFGSARITGDLPDIFDSFPSLQNLRLS
ncbi:hypothetical protein HN51_057071 [Arachis hypogaea]